MMPLILITMVITFVLDQISKYYITHSFEYLQTIPLVPKVIHFTYVHNYGAGFGILQNQRWFLIIVALLVLVLVLYFYKKLPQDWLARFAIGLALGGNLGNLIDRVRIGYVVDFLEFEFIHFPVFNIADSAIVVGTILLALKILFTGQEMGEIEDAGDPRV